MRKTIEICTSSRALDTVMDRGLQIPPETMMSDPSAPPIYTHPHAPATLPELAVIGMNFGWFPGRYICQNP